MTTNSFGARDEFRVDGRAYEIFRLDRVTTRMRIPYSLKILLENLLRNEDGHVVTKDQIEALRNWDPTVTDSTEIEYTPARVLMQDFTGVPCVVDLVAMRDAMAELGGDPRMINPQIPAESSSTTPLLPTCSPVPMPPRSMPISSSNAMKNATGCSGGPGNLSATSSSCRPIPEFVTKSTWNISHASFSHANHPG